MAFSPSQNLFWSVKFYDFPDFRVSSYPPPLSEKKNCTWSLFLTSQISELLSYSLPQSENFLDFVNFSWFLNSTRPLSWHKNCWTSSVFAEFHNFHTTSRPRRPCSDCKTIMRVARGWYEYSIWKSSILGKVSFSSFSFVWKRVPRTCWTNEVVLLWSLLAIERQLGSWVHWSFCCGNNHNSPQLIKSFLSFFCFLRKLISVTAWELRDNLWKRVMLPLSSGSHFRSEEKLSEPCLHLCTFPWSLSNTMENIKLDTITWKGSQFNGFFFTDQPHKIIG